MNTIQLNLFAPPPLSPLEQLQFDVYKASYKYLFKGRKPEDSKRCDELKEKYWKMLVDTGNASIYLIEHLEKRKK